MKVLKSIIIILLVCLLTSGCGGVSEKKVVVYTSVDQVYAEPILKQFEKETGIKVMAVYDVEAAKTTGLVNRLIAEKNRPQADVFWNSEFIQTMLLKEEGVLSPYRPATAADLPEESKDKDGFWTAFGGRVRVLIVNTDLVPVKDYPNSIYDLATSPHGGDKAAIAFPMFGTTATHAAALYAALGSEQGKQFFVNLKQNKVQAVDGNSVVRDLVAAGRLKMGLTDSDDACGAIKKKAPVKIILPDQDGLGTLIVPNTAALIAGAPNPEAAKKLLDYLASKQVEQALVKSGFSHVSSRPGMDESDCMKSANIKRMKVDYQAVYNQLKSTKKEMSELYVR
ncbi:MAG: extracellular solute-binding protein [Negativicutes bacterium]|nr:extracellular solute-binding protein [Negativicutes bacterium]